MIRTKPPKFKRTKFSRTKKKKCGMVRMRSGKFRRSDVDSKYLGGGLWARSTKCEKQKSASVMFIQDKGFWATQGVICKFYCKDQCSEFHEFKQEE